MLKAINLECTRGKRRLFHGLSFELEAGASVFVQGQNGSGKTSLLRILAGLSPPCTGTVCWKGNPIQKLEHEWRRDLFYYGHLVGLKDDLTATENLVYAAALTNEPVSHAAVVEALHQSGLQGREHLPVRALSQGQKRRASLARLLLHRRPLWILDEPLTTLDDKATQWVIRMISDHLREGGIAVWTSHLDMTLSATTRTLRIGL
ncbi:cytochrome c biogenesis heme-transporting ATPase CcmA [Allopusillimonas ginsengisoli]|uniref:cytochrome c biogenesis heme-transporting ATPase CcmA n=1 Tax=Allopusillimonas ginsengisoli TaxID=453575 RepID=UPI0039C242D4